MVIWAMDRYCDCLFRAFAIIIAIIGGVVISFADDIDRRTREADKAHRYRIISLILFIIASIFLATFIIIISITINVGKI